MVTLICSLVSLQVAADQIVPTLPGIRPENSASHRQSWRLAGFRRGRGVFHSASGFSDRVAGSLQPSAKSRRNGRMDRLVAAGSVGRLHFPGTLSLPGRSRGAIAGIKIAAADAPLQATPQTKLGQIRGTRSTAVCPQRGIFGRVQCPRQPARCEPSVPCAAARTWETWRTGWLPGGQVSWAPRRRGADL